MAPKKKEPAARKKKDPTPVLPELDANRHHDTRRAETGTQLESITSCVPVSSPGPFPVRT